MYDELDVYEDDGEDDAVDNAGYTGNFHRIKMKLTPISDADFLMCIMNKDRLT